VGGGTHYVVAPERSGRSGCHDGTDELPGGPVSQGAVRVDLVVVGEPGGQGPEYGLCIGAGADADVVALEGPDEPPSAPPHPPRQGRFTFLTASVGSGAGLR